MSQNHGIKGGTNEAFQEQCFLWEKEASVGRFIYNIYTKRKGKKYRSPLNINNISYTNK